MSNPGFPMDTFAHLKLISAQIVEDVLDYPSLVAAVERGLGNFSNSKNAGIEQPVRSSFTVSKSYGWFGSMPVYSKPDDVIVTKIVTVFPQNISVPVTNSVVLAFDTNTGVLKAMMDGNTVTNKRTAAASVVATKHLVNGDPSVLAILGSGVQAQSHYAAFSEFFNFKQIKVWNYKLEGAQRLVAAIGKKGMTCSTVEEAVRDADVIVTVTHTTEPIVKAEWVKPGAHINVVDANQAHQATLYPDLMRASVVYVDSYDAASKESGDVILSKAEMFAEIGEVINGTKPARKAETTVFKSQGLAIEDAVAAKIVMEKLGI